MANDHVPDRPRFTTLETNWQHFNAADIAPEAQWQQRREMQRAFMAGAASALSLAMDARFFGDFDAKARELLAELGSWLAVANARRRHG